MTVPKLFYIYREDFGGTDENILRFIFKYYKCEENDVNMDEE
jgi:hypothetical protein